MTPHTRRSAARTALLVASIVAAFGVLEGGARVVEWLRAGDARARAAVRVEDPLLEYRVEPNTGGHDDRGYRNVAALDRADIVTLGDSQTWGENADLDESWPAQLAAATDLRVYNMGRGGYGLLQYREQLEEALTLAPAFVVVALYFGNDFLDAYDLAYGLEGQARWRHPDAAERARIAASAYPDLRRMLFERVGYRRAGLAPAEWLLEWTAVGRLAAGALARVDPQNDRDWAVDHPDEGFVYEIGPQSTVFHTTYRLAAVDTRLARIEEGVRITLAALVDAQGRVDEAPETKLLVVLLPTKERAFAAAIRAAHVATPKSYSESVAFERTLAARLSEWMDTHGIAHVDALPALEAAIARGEGIFPPNADGHFTPAGYAVVARVVALAVASAGRLEPR